MSIKWVVLDMMGVVFEEGDTMSTVLHPYLNALKGDVSSEDINALYILGRVGRMTSKQIFETLGFKEDPIKVEEGFLKLIKLDPQFNISWLRSRTMFRNGRRSSAICTA